MKTAFLFSGQGAQYVGMGKEFYENFECARNIFDEAVLKMKKNLIKQKTHSLLY